MSANGHDAEFDGNFDRDRVKTLGRPHTFVVGEKTFHFRKGVEQEVFDRYFDVLDAATKTSNIDFLARLDETVLAFLDPGQDESWEAVRHEIEQPVLVAEIMGIIAYMMAVTTGRPTVRSSDSGDTPEQPSTSSTEQSPSPAAAT